MTTPRTSGTQISDRALERVAKGERVRVRRKGRPAVYLVSETDLKILEEIEDRLDIEAADAALADMKAKGEKPIPWEKVKKELGL